MKRKRVSSLELGKALESLNWALVLEETATKLLAAGRVEEAELATQSCAIALNDLSTKLSEALQLEILVFPGGLVQHLTKYEPPTKAEG